MKTILRRIRGTLGTALVWGGMWFVAAFPIAAVYFFFDVGLGSLLSLSGLAALLLVSSVIGLVGFITGGAFSAYVTATFRDKRLEDLSPGRFAVWGSLVAVSLTLLALSLLTLAAMGELPFLGELITPTLFSATLGGLTGYGTVKLAQKAVEPGASADKLESGSERLLNQN